MKDFIIPLLTEKDIDCRVQSCSKSQKTGKVGAILLLYKDARVDMKILDLVFGAGNWQRTHEVINGNLFCNLDIWDDDKKCWVRKQDVGVESNTEKVKGEASDAFKRACFNIGIGRSELYSVPLIYVVLNEGEYSVDKRGNEEKYKCYQTFKVSSIAYDDNREVNDLVIADRSGTVRFEYHGNKPAQEKKPAKVSAPKKESPAVLKCETCGNDITEAEYNYSKKVYGVPACRNCQKFMPKQ